MSGTHQSDTVLNKHWTILIMIKQITPDTISLCSTTWCMLVLCTAPWPGLPHLAQAAWRCTPIGCGRTHSPCEADAIALVLAANEGPTDGMHKRPGLGGHTRTDIMKTAVDEADLV